MLLLKELELHVREEGDKFKVTMGEAEDGKTVSGYCPRNEKTLKSQMVFWRTDKIYKW